MFLAVVEVIGLGKPAWWQFGGERGMNGPGDGRGVRAAGIPLQDERHELRWFDWPDHGRGVRGCEGGDEQDPVDVALVGPAGGGQFGVREVDGRRADARWLEGLPLAQCPGREQVRRSGAENVVSQVVQRDRVLAGKAVAWPQPDQERLCAEHLVGYSLRGGDQAAGYGHISAIPAFIRADFASAIRDVLYGMAIIMAVAALVALRGLRRGVQEDTTAAGTGLSDQLPDEDPGADLDPAWRLGPQVFSDGSLSPPSRPLTSPN